MGENTIRITPFTGEKEKWRMWSGKFMAGVGIKVYHVLLTGARKKRLTTKKKYRKKKFRN